MYVLYHVFFEYFALVSDSCFFALYAVLCTEPLYCVPHHGYEEMTYIPVYTSDVYEVDINYIMLHQDYLYYEPSPFCTNTYKIALQKQDSIIFHC